MEIFWANQNSSLILKFKENCRSVLLLTCFSGLRNTNFGFRALTRLLFSKSECMQRKAAQTTGGQLHGDVTKFQTNQS